MYRHSMRCKFWLCSPARRTEVCLSFIGGDRIVINVWISLGGGNCNFGDVSFWVALAGVIVAMVMVIVLLVLLLLSQFQPRTLASHST